MLEGSHRILPYTTQPYRYATLRYSSLLYPTLPYPTMDIREAVSRGPLDQTWFREADEETRSIWLSMN